MGDRRSKRQLVLTPIPTSKKRPISSKAVSRPAIIPRKTVIPRRQSCTPVPRPSDFQSVSASRNSTEIDEISVSLRSFLSSIEEELTKVEEYRKYVDRATERLINSLRERQKQWINELERLENDLRLQKEAVLQDFDGFRKPGNVGKLRKPMGASLLMEEKVEAAAKAIETMFTFQVFRPVLDSVQIPIHPQDIPNQFPQGKEDIFIPEIDSSDRSLSCSFCHSPNPVFSSFGRCSVCDRVNYPKMREDEVRENLLKGKWTCTECLFRNVHSNEACIGCGYVRKRLEMA